MGAGLRAHRDRVRLARVRHKILRSSTGLRFQRPQPSGEARAEMIGARRHRLSNLVAPKRTGNGTSDARKGRPTLLHAQQRAGRS